MLLRFLRCSVVVRRVVLYYVAHDLGPLEYAYIIAMGDLHIGDPLFNEKKFLDFRDWILKTPNTYIVLLGDVLNCAIKGSKSDFYGELMPVQQAKKYALQVLEPVAIKILGLVAGNHELRCWRETGNDPAEDIATALKVPYSPDGLLLNIKLGNYNNKKDCRLNYLLYMTHGYGGGRSKGSKTNVLDRTSAIVDADIFVVGHIHFMTCFKDQYIRADVRHNRIEKITRTYVSAGSFLNWGGYSERMMLPPAKLGAPRIRLDGYRKDVHVSI